MRQSGRTPGRWWRAAPLAPGFVLVLGAGALAQPADNASRRHLVEMQGMTFRPAVLEIGRGDTVVWVNRDIVPHTATATSKPLWSTGTLAQDQRGEYVARASGTYAYFCELHPAMKGELVIR